MIERQIESPMPMPLDLVVKKALNSLSAFSEEIPTPESSTVTSIVSLVAEGSLKPQIGSERSWRDLDKTLDELRDRRIAGKAVFRIE